ncbi:MAG TPA: serine--tRNA ligase [Candidatus Methanofastidiosa archaeon]|nr:serine--tRNA ligase [Candidatus Methanofastidiosa archaeon]
MLDIRLFRENPGAIRSNMEKRGLDQGAVEEIIGIDSQRRNYITEVNSLKKERNDVAAKIRDMKSAGNDISPEVKRMREINDTIDSLDQAVRDSEAELRSKLMRMPNILHDTVPVGEENISIREWGIKDHLGFEPKSHVDILDNLGIADIERASRISGSRFYFLKGDLVLLDYALMKYAMDALYQKGYTIIEPPYMLKRAPYEGVTDLGDFEEVMYKIEDEDLYLIATSEHPMAAMYMDEIFDPEALPLRYAGISPCFRKEAGSHGKDTKGIFRVHQFNKVEQFIFCNEEESWGLFEELIDNAESLYKGLEIPYRIVNICTGDIGTVAAKKYDLEAWMPAQGTYRELVSCSNCTDYQARRLNIRYRTKDGNKMCHTLNSTAIATTRTLVALIENYQREDGSIDVPKALRPYMMGKKEITAV